MPKTKTRKKYTWKKQPNPPPEYLHRNMAKGHLTRVRNYLQTIERDDAEVLRVVELSVVHLMATSLTTILTDWDKEK